MADATKPAVVAPKKPASGPRADRSNPPYVNVLNRTGKILDKANRNDAIAVLMFHCQRFGILCRLNTNGD